MSELAAAAAVDGEISTRNLLSFSTVAIDQAGVESQYTRFKVWISESADQVLITYIIKFLNICLMKH